MPGYSTVRLRTASDRHKASRIEIRPGDTGRESLNDVRADPVVSEILEREDVHFDEAEDLIYLSDDLNLAGQDGPFRPRVTIGFSAGCVGFDQFVLERVLLAIDDIVRAPL